MYKITIKKITEVEYKKQGDYCVVDERPFTQEEVDKANKDWSSNLDSNTLKKLKTMLHHTQLLKLSKLKFIVNKSMI